ncbi:ABC transporter family substrate-binding protein [Corynebacterium pseudotuberculosis]|uniref:ABC transporter family substrate-binding protein n=1 Tax=Corynebacterium pseudotuberculosis TaxID=1719 RepID=UPI000265FC0C|nr:ABC transporter family substrate-binding protein [Corynebacterium pseudotuberculosis]APG81340.1 Monoacyl phosphatidylinositol tetramannoside-binding protein [Corynebacterium pseudotuberculosis]WFP67941.1 ABC transporter family substrate-binding protein [Corynebacterium pseudotuberculosis]
MMNKHRVFLATVSAAVLVSCSANPGPAPVEKEPEATPATSAASSTSATPKPEKKTKKTLSIGIDPVTGGLNPHVLSDDSVFVRALASLVLPSAFVGGEINADLLTSAQEIEPAAGAGVVQTVRYSIRSEAQWSDGTPITVSDFQYLWEAKSTNPGVLDASKYRAITGIRSSNGGRTVEVDFATKIANWKTLFSSLLPSHLLRDSDASFASVMAHNIPASGWKYSLANVDKQRGILTLNRNDRFWGKKPAKNETITFSEVRDVAQGAEMLRAGQIHYLDITPTEVARETFELMPNTQVRTQESPLKLQLIANLNLSEAQRAELQSLVDRRLIARLAMGRSSDLVVGPENYDPHADLLTALGRDVRIGVDPADPHAENAARALVDLLARHGVGAKLVTADITSLLGTKLIDGGVDAIMTWSSANNLDRYQCSRPKPATNFTNWCNKQTDAEIRDVLAGARHPEDFNLIAGNIEASQHFTTDITKDLRLQVRGSRIVGPNPQSDQWPEELAALATWTPKED